MLGCAQSHHPRVRFPRTFQPVTVLINNQNVGYPFTQQAEGCA